MPGDRWLAPKREGAKRPTPLSATARGSCYSIFKERWRGTLSRRGQESFAKPGLRTLGRSVSIWLVPQRLFSATYEAFYSRVYRLELEHSARHSAARGSAADVVRPLAAIEISRWRGRCAPLVAFCFAAHCGLRLTRHSDKRLLAEGTVLGQGLGLYSRSSTA